MGDSSGTVDTAPEDFVSAGGGLSAGLFDRHQLEAYVDNAAQVLYGADSQYDPFHAPSTSFTVTQPLLRGRGRG